MHSFRLVALFALLLCVPAALAQTKPHSLYYSRLNTFGFFGEYSNTSSHILLGISRNRKLLDFGGFYTRRVLLDRFVDGHTPFATKHSVKGDEFENVLVVLGRGWNHYNFDQFLELSAAPDLIAADKQAFYGRNRNLFYVACSRPTTRLALFFTQLLSPTALRTLQTWFGADAVSNFSHPSPGQAGPSTSAKAAPLG